MLVEFWIRLKYRQWDARQEYPLCSASNAYVLLQRSSIWNDGNLISIAYEYRLLHEYRFHDASYELR